MLVSSSGERHFGRFGCAFAINYVMVVIFAELHITCFLFLQDLMVKQVERNAKLSIFGEKHLSQLEPRLGMLLLTQKYVQYNSRKTVSKEFDRHY